MTLRMTIQRRDANLTAYIGDADDVQGHIVWAPKSCADYIMEPKEAALAGLPAGVRIDCRVSQDFEARRLSWNLEEDADTRWDLCAELLETLFPDHVGSFDRCSLHLIEGGVK